MGTRVVFHGDALAAGIVPGTVELLTTISGDVKADAKRGVPVDTGDLQRDIDSYVDEALLVAYVFATLHYAAYVELGTSKTHPQPYLRPALYRLRAGA